MSLLSLSLNNFCYSLTNNFCNSSDNEMFWMDGLTNVGVMKVELQWPDIEALAQGTRVGAWDHI